MRNRYSAVIMIPDQYGPHHNPVAVGTFKTHRAAQNALRRYETTSTRYTGTDVTLRTNRKTYRSHRGFWGEVYKDERCVQVVEFDNYIVPSVGELGWTP